MLSSSIVAALKSTLGAGVIVERNQLQTYECDGLVVLCAVPAAVALPRSAAEVQTVVQICAQHRIPLRCPRCRHWTFTRGTPPLLRYIVKSGTQWRMMPNDLPSWWVVYR